MRPREIYIGERAGGRPKPFRHCASGLRWPTTNGTLIDSGSKEFYTDDPKSFPDYGRIINQRHFKRILAMTEDSEVAVGGDSDEADCYIGTGVGLQNTASWINPRCRGQPVFFLTLGIKNAESKHEC